MASGFDVVGKSTPKRDGPDKVTGRTRYLHDLELPRLLHGKILTDTGAARADRPGRHEPGARAARAWSRC